MPLFSSIIMFVVHILIALGLNLLGQWAGVIRYGEIFTAYFLIFAFRLYDSQNKFTTAYKEDPDLVEQLLRDQLSRDGR